MLQRNAGAIYGGPRVIELALGDIRVSSIDGGITCDQPFGVGQLYGSQFDCQRFIAVIELQEQIALGNCGVGVNCDRGDATRGLGIDRDAFESSSSTYRGQGLSQIGELCRHCRHGHSSGLAAIARSSIARAIAAAHQHGTGHRCHQRD